MYPTRTLLVPYSYGALPCQVVLFNYRGYSRSTGKPSPSNNSNDGVALVRHLKEVSQSTVNCSSIFRQS